MTKRLTEQVKQEKKDFKKLNEGLIAGCIIEGFHKRYPSLNIDKMPTKQFDKLPLKFWEKYQNRLHIYAMGFKDALKVIHRLRSHEPRPSRHAEGQGMNGGNE